MAQPYQESHISRLKSGTSIGGGPQSCSSKPRRLYSEALLRKQEFRDEISRLELIYSRTTRPRHANGTGSFEARRPSDPDPLSLVSSL